MVRFHYVSLTNCGLPSRLALRPKHWNYTMQACAVCNMVTGEPTNEPRVFSRWIVPQKVRVRNMETRHRQGGLVEEALMLPSQLPPSVSEKQLRYLTLLFGQCITCSPMCDAIRVKKLDLTDPREDAPHSSVYPHKLKALVPSFQDKVPTEVLVLYYS